MDSNLLYITKRYMVIIIYLPAAGRPEGGQKIGSYLHEGCEKSLGLLNRPRFGFHEDINVIMNLIILIIIPQKICVKCEVSSLKGTEGGGGGG